MAIDFCETRRNEQEKFKELVAMVPSAIARSKKEGVSEYSILARTFFKKPAEELTHSEQTLIKNAIIRHIRVGPFRCD